MRKALIFGISGQDGSYLAELLIEKGYQVHGVVRRHSIAENQDNRLSHLEDVVTHYGDLLDTSSIYKVINEIQPVEIYNLAAQSHVGISSHMPQFTAQVNAIGVVNILEAMKQHVPLCRFYQASSSECFGNSVDTDGFQRETTPMVPVSPYGCAKVFGYHITRHYRNAYDMFASNGILFNHSSPRRGANFVTQKIVRGAVDIKYHQQEKLFLGNLQSYRDEGHSKDYVEAMWLMMQHTEPDDFVIASMEPNSIEEFARLVFSKLDLEYEEYVISDVSAYKRPQELNYLKGDSTKARTVLDWTPEHSFDSLIDDMIRSYEQRYKN